jgi:KH/beta-lactamase-domain protein
MLEILEKVKELLPKNVIDKLELEGSEIIVYTKNRDFFRNCDEIIRSAVEQLKKRIEVRADSSILMDKEETKKIILENVKQEAGIKNIFFEQERSLVFIAAEKPGLVIGKGGELFKKIKLETFWSPRIERVPSVSSDIVDGIRKMMHTESKFRKEFLNNVGKSIFEERKTSRNWIRVIGLGGWNEVGRSCMLVETPKSKVLVDCGIKASATSLDDLLPIFGTKEFDYNEIDAIIVSHSHLDHIGAVPILYERGYSGPVYMTVPTLDLATLLWLDYIDVMQKNAVNPLYTASGVKEAVKRAITLEYGEVSDVAPDIRLTFQPAGHILGSAIVHLHIGDGLHNLVYALDQKFAKSNLLDQAFTNFPRVETLVIESTYGGRNDVMPRREEVEKQFMDVVNKTMERKGIVLIPAFSVERSQELMAILVKNNFQHPVYLDGMIWDANGIFTAYPEYFGRNMQRKMFSGENPFVNPIFKRIASQQEREKVWEEKECIIISTSGMLNGGPVLQHLQHLAEDPRNTLIFVGYQAEGSLGRRIQKGWKEIPVNLGNGKTTVINLNMEVYTAEGLSAHSDRKQLLNFIGHLSSKPNKVICVHGEPQKAADLANSISRIFKIEACAPKNLEAIRLK